MIRRAFIRRMVFAGLATWFLDLPLPMEASADGESAPQAVGFVDMTLTLADGEGGEAEVFVPRGRFRTAPHPGGGYLVDIWGADGNPVDPWKKAVFHQHVDGPSSYLFPPRRNVAERAGGDAVDAIA